MKKKIDAMTVISILLIVINLLFLLPVIFGGSCSSELEIASQTSLLSFVQLFGGTVYAAGLPISSSVSALDGIIRSYGKSIANDI